MLKYILLAPNVLNRMYKTLPTKMLLIMMPSNATQQYPGLPPTKRPKNYTPTSNAINQIPEILRGYHIEKVLNLTLGLYAGRRLWRYLLLGF